jgi:protein arginine N-methyltransferase 5
MLSRFQNMPPIAPHEEYIAPYHDTLQSPLQPLADNMGNAVYETFEYDKKKYELYEEAVFRALRDMLGDDSLDPRHPLDEVVFKFDESVALNGDYVVGETPEAISTESSVPERSPKTVPNSLSDSNKRTRAVTQIHLAVCGAGRGGLVDAILTAISRLCLKGNEEFKITCVEKNKNAFRTLQFRLKNDPKWSSVSANTLVISLVNGDMRQWTPETPIDILVSELLGSLGDNEASPECLDGVIHHLNPVRGISIPHNYYSAIEPISSHKLWMNAREMGKFENVLVAQLQTIFRPIPISGQLTMFAFDHQRISDTSSMIGGDGRTNRSISLSWTMEIDTTIHGFAGYFHSDLYGGVTMSTNPPTQTPGMVSWFPAFLPLNVPIHLVSGQTISVVVERKCTESKMWVEWTVVEPVVQPTNNRGGSAHSVRLV